ncbi:LuxR C-terminal-related transcriptional regulator [Noviherbaspirillum sedimenti]|uniref:LuxR C-terminal-related transcriptional regulator n=1 Tax=Noviherbaspirillum sedimenti TaxID=2320865 RepID=UPI00308272E3
MRTSPSVKIILVRAPAGFGKTTAMVQARLQLDAGGIDTAWLTLDASDNDASRFLTCLSAAVTKMTAPEFPIDLDAAQAANYSPGDIALGIIEKLASHASPFALFLDDFEAVKDPTVLRLVREILDNLPRRGQLIIGSRGLPDLGLGRLRARGQLLEIDIRQLRFSMKEAAEFLRQRRLLSLPEEDLSELYRKTEGWIAALWLASVALEKREGGSEFIARFSGSNEAVAEYLAEDVLARQPADMRDFLLKTSILHYLQPALCNALLPQTDSAAILRQLEAANIFLIRIEGEQDTYRYHSLFAGFLRNQLKRELPAELARLHSTASQWYESQGRPVLAIDHALEGENYERALSLLSLHAESLLEGGRMRLLTRWFDAIPEALLDFSPLLQVVRIWALCFTRGPWDAMELLERSECARTTDPHVLTHVLALRPMLLAMMDRNEEAFELGREALSRLPVSKPFPDCVLANEMAYIFSIMGQYHESHKLLDAARRSQADGASIFNKMYSESVEGIIDLEAGQLRQATARFRIAVGATHAASYAHTGGNAWAGVLYAGSLYEMNDLEEAEHLLHVYVPLAKDAGLADHMIIGYIMLSRIASYHGDIDLAFQTLTELEYLGHQRKLPRVVASAKLERSRLLLMQNNRQAARDELDRANNREVWEQVRRLRLPAQDLDYFALGELRWEIFCGDANKALSLLEAEIAQASGAMRHRRVLKLRLLRALALKQSGDQRAALAQISELLKITCAEGFIRLIVDEGAGAAHLVRQHVVQLQEESSQRRDPIFDEYLQRLLDGFGQSVITEAAETDLPMSATPKGLVEPLTAKEIRMMVLLADGYSNSALAEKLFVSDSTVRTHLRNINAKLNAHSRTEAVAIARRLGVIR